jgi:hypothetical protein
MENMPVHLFVPKPAFFNAILQVLIGPLVGTDGTKHFACTPKRKGQYNVQPYSVQWWVIKNGFFRQLGSAADLHAFWRSARGVDDHPAAVAAFKVFEDLRCLIDAYTLTSYEELGDMEAYKLVERYMNGAIAQEVAKGGVLPASGAEAMGCDGGGSGGFVVGGGAASGTLVVVPSFASTSGGSGSASVGALRTKRRTGKKMVVRELGSNLAVFSEALAAEALVTEGRVRRIRMIPMVR